MVGSVINFAGGVFWGRFADRTGRYKWTMLTTNVASVAFACCFTLPVIAGSFAVFLADYVLYAFFGSCWGTLVDAVAVIGRSQGGGSYGKLRLWAAVGWGSLAVLTGILVDLTDLRAIFVTFTVGMAISSAIVACSFSDPPRVHTRPALRATTDVDRSFPEKTVPGSVIEAVVNGDGSDENDSAELDLGAILCRTEVFLLLLNLFVQGMLVAFVESFLYVYLAEVYGCPAFFLGLCTMVAAAFECPVFYYSEELIRRFGVRGLLTIAQFLYAGRVWAYTVIPNNPSATGYWLFLLTEPLHAFVFAAMWSASVEYSRRLAPARHQGTMQALVRGMYYFIGNGVGSVLGGLLIDSKHDGAAGYHFMYRFGAVAMAAWSLTWHALMAMDARCCQRKKGSGQRAPGAGAGRGALRLARGVSQGHGDPEAAISPLSS